MNIDRRQFIQLGAFAAFASTACHSKPNLDVPIMPGTTALNNLRVGFEGLYLIEEKPSSMVVHLVDGPAVGMPAHLAQLSALASTIDKTQTTKPDATHVIPAGLDEIWLWDLKGREVTTPPSAGGESDLTLPGTSNEDGDEIPTTSAGWNSLARVPDLRVCCGASKIIRPDAFSSSITLTHGRVGVLEPGGVGARAVWRFVDPSGMQLMQRALSNRVQYACPTNGRQLVIRVGNDPIVFKSFGAAVAVKNLPMTRPAPCGNPCTPNMNHFPALFQVVDKKFDATISLARFVPKTQEDAGADYCPGGRI